MGQLSWISRETNFEWCLAKSVEFSKEEKEEIQAIADLLCTGIILNVTGHKIPEIPFYSAEGDSRLRKLNYHTFNSLEYEGRRKNIDLINLLEVETFSVLPKVYKIIKPCYEKVIEMFPTISKFFIDKNDFEIKLKKFLDLELKVYKVKIRLKRKIMRELGWVNNVKGVGEIQNEEIDWSRKQEFLYFSGYLGYYFVHNILTGDIRII